MISVRAHEEGATVIATELQTMAERALNPRPAFEAIHAYLLNVERIQFERGGKRGYHQWAPAAPSTRQKKRRVGLRYKLMYATEDLYRSLTSPSAPGHVFRIIGNTEMEFGSDVLEFRVQQEESSAASGGFPWRPPIDLTDYDERKAARLIEAFIVNSQILPSMGL